MAITRETRIGGSSDTLSTTKHISSNAGLNPRIHNQNLWRWSCACVGIDKWVICSLFSVKDKSVKSLSSAKVLSIQTLSLRFQISWTRICLCFCLRLVAYHILWILAQMLLFHSIILCQQLLRRATQTDKLPCRWLWPWVNRGEDTVASYLSAIRVLSVELRNWIDLRNSVMIGVDVNITTNIQFKPARATFVFLFLWQLAMMECLLLFRPEAVIRVLSSTTLNA